MAEATPTEVQQIAHAETIGDAVRRLTASFRSAGLDTPELDARILVADAAAVPRSVLIVRPEQPLTEQQSYRIHAFAVRRLAREPVTRIVGKREFYGLEFALAPSTLDPRPDTETAVDAVLELVGSRGGETLHLLDLGTGTGAILVALLSRLPRATGVGTDIDRTALEVARRNAQTHGVTARAQFVHSHWLQDVRGTFDIIVSNPPYVPSGEIASLEPEVARHDPRRALDGGVDGLMACRAIAEDARKALRPDGRLVLEVGTGQADTVLEICQAHGLEPDQSAPHIWYDLAGRPRCVAVKTRW